MCVNCYVVNCRMSMMPPHMAMMQAQGNPTKPLFPSAVPTSSPGATIVGADFKPISSGSDTFKVHFLLHYNNSISSFIHYHLVINQYFRLSCS